MDNRPNILKPIEIKKSIQDDTIEMTLEFSSNSPVDVTWYRNKVKLKSSKRIKIETTENKSKLVISKIMAKDEGEYMVEMRNNFGQRSSKANLQFDYNQVKLSLTHPVDEKERKKQASLHIQKVLKPFVSSVTKIKIGQDEDVIKKGNIILFTNLLTKLSLTS